MAAPTATRTFKLDVGGMTCASCVSAVATALNSVEGVVKAEVSLLAHTAQVTVGIGAGLSPEQLVEAVEMVGFDAKYLPSKPPPRKLPVILRSSFAIEGMTCASCVSTVQSVLNGLDGVMEATVSLLQHEAKVLHDPSKATTQAIAEVVEMVGFGAEFRESSTASEQSGGVMGADVHLSNEETWASPIIVVVGTDHSAGPDDAVHDATALTSAGAATASSKDWVLVATAALASVATVRASLSAVPETAGSIDGDEGGGRKPALRGEEREIVVRGKEGTPSSGWLRSRHVLAILRAAGVPTRLPDGMAEEAETVKVSAAAAAAADVLRWRQRLVLAAIPTVVVIIVSMILGHLFPNAVPFLNESVGGVYGLSWRSLILWVLVTPVVFGTGWPFISNAYKRLRGGCTMGMDFLIVTGSLTAYVFSVMEIVLAIAAGSEDGAQKPTEFFEASAAIVTLVVFGKFLESAAKGRTADALTSLVELQPSQAMVLEPADLARVSARHSGLNLRSASDSGALLLPEQAELLADDAEHDDGAIAADVGVELAPPTPKAVGTLRTVSVAIGDGVSAGAAAMGIVSSTSYPGCVVTAMRTERVETGDVIRVAPGARVPVDGEVVAGSSIVDESAMTGEAMPVRKAVGDEALAATVNVGKGVLLVRATRVGRDTAIAHVISLVEDAQMSSAPVQALADRISGVFAPVVLVLALLTAAGWGVAAAAGAVPDDWVPPALGYVGFCLRFGLAVVVIACPCALGLATPTAVMVGTGVAARLGVLIKGGQPLETLQGVKAIMFDKTGTLTEGKPQLVAVVVTDPALTPPLEEEDDDDTEHCTAAATARSCAASKPDTTAPAQGAAASGGTGGSCSEVASAAGVGSSAASCATATGVGTGLPDEGSGLLDQFRECLLLAAVAEAGSDHPLGQAIVSAAKRALGAAELDVEASAFEEEAGHGVKATIAGKQVCVGTRRWMKQHGVEVSSRVDREKAILELLGHTAVLVGVDGQTRAVLALADKIKEEALTTVAQLQSMGVAVHILTGDNRRAAAAVARELGVPEANVQAEVLPADKIAAVKAMQERGVSVAMVGDGINDAPALAQADVGIAIGAGTQVAIDAGDVVLVKSDLTDVVTAIDLSRAVLRRIWVNYFFSMGYNVLGIPIAAGLFFPILRVALPPEVAALTMALSSVCVVLSSLLLRLYRSPAQIAARNGASTSGLAARKRRSAGAGSFYTSLHDDAAESSRPGSFTGEDSMLAFGPSASIALTSSQMPSPSAASVVHRACTCTCSDCTAKLRFHVSDNSHKAASRLAMAVVKAHRAIHGPSASCKCACVCNAPKSPAISEPCAAERPG